MIPAIAGAWVDLSVGHQETGAPDHARQPSSPADATEPTPADETLLAVCRTTYPRIAALLAGNVSAAQLAIAEELRRAGFELDEHNEELIAGTRTIMAVLDDGQTVQRLWSGDWVILRDYV